MHAVVFRVDLKQDFTGDVDAELDQVTSMTKSIPGFVRGTWVTDGTTGLSFLLFDNEQVAQQVAGNAAMPAEASVVFRSVAVYEVARDI